MGADGGGLAVVIGVALCVLACNCQPMKRLAILLVAFAVLSSGAAYGNSFLDGMVGRWSSTVTVTLSANGRVVEKETFKGENRITKLRNGTYYSVSLTEGIKTGEKWYFKNGKISSIIYTDEGDYNGEGSGTWRIRNGRLVVDETAETLEVEKFALNTSTRRISRNRYAMSGTGVANETLPATANNTVRLRAAGTYVRRR